MYNETSVHFGAMIDRQGERHGGTDRTLFALNVQSPPAPRAQLLARWLQEQNWDILALTELSSGKGSELLIEELQLAGYRALTQRPDARDYAAAILWRNCKVEAITHKPVELGPRVQAVGLSDPGQGLLLVTAYVPALNLNNAERRPAFLLRLKAWLESIRQAGSQAVVIGDLNIVEPHHVPRVPAFEFEQPFAYGLFTEAGLVDAFRYVSPLSCEHSWYDRNASGQRIDHALVSGSLVDTVMACRYVHETRDLKLSDHSGLLLRLAAYER